MDAEKTGLRPQWAISTIQSCHLVLKNLGVTYQRAMTAIFRDMLHDCIKAYVDIIVVKTKEVS